MSLFFLVILSARFPDEGMVTLVVKDFAVVKDVSLERL
jgi:hypothetical protein